MPWSCRQKNVPRASDSEAVNLVARRRDGDAEVGLVGERVAEHANASSGGRDLEGVVSPPVRAAVEGAINDHRVSDRGGHLEADGRTRRRRYERTSIDARTVGA